MSQPADAASRFRVSQERAAYLAGALFALARTTDRDLGDVDRELLDAASLALGERAGASFDDELADALLRKWKEALR